MSAYEEIDQVVAHALQVCADVRECGSRDVYSRLAVACMRQPDRMAQVLMCLAIFVDYEGPVRVLMDRAEAIAMGVAS